MYKGNERWDMWPTDDDDRNDEEQIMLCLWPTYLVISKVCSIAKLEGFVFDHEIRGGGLFGSTRRSYSTIVLFGLRTKEGWFVAIRDATIHLWRTTKTRRLYFSLQREQIRLFGRTGDVTVINIVVPIHVAAMMTCKFTQRRNLTFSSLISVDMLFNLGSR